MNHQNNTKHEVEELSKQIPQFVVALTEHRLFGHILVPFLIVPNQQGTFYSIVSTVLKTDLQQQAERFSKIEKQLVELMDKYSEEVLARKFSRNQGSKDFFQKIDQKFFNEHITPYIDKQIVECLRIIGENKVRLYYKAAKYNNLYDEDLITIGTTYAMPTFHFHLDDQGLTYRLSVKYKNQNLKLLFKKPLMVSDTPCRMVLHNELIAFEKISGKRLAPFLEKEQVKIPPTVVEKYMKGFVLKLIQEHHVEASGFDIIEMDEEKKAILSIEQGMDLNPMLVLKFSYGSKIFPAGKAGQVEVEFRHQSGQFQFFKHQRDADWEKGIVNFLKELGLVLNSSMLMLSPKNKLNNDDRAYSGISWINQHQPQLQKVGIVIQQALDGKRFYLGSQQLKVDLKMQSDWFDLYAVVTFGEFQVPFIRLRKHILNGKREYLLPNGEVVILPEEWFAQFSELLPFAEQTKEGFRLSKHHFKLFEGKISIDETLRKQINELYANTVELQPVPEGLNAKLRLYQAEGYSWMHMLGMHGFGGCLADDMGLGKTLQTLVLLLKEKMENQLDQQVQPTITDQQLELFTCQPNSKPASLIIVPTSLVHNWKNEVKKFTPQLKVYLHQGVHRKRSESLKRIADQYDVILTTYGTLRNDFALLSTIPFNYLILDESQYIKNSESKTYQSVCTLQADKRLVLTGTPIENSLTDLWSQLNFLNPGLLGSMQYFKKAFIHPIEKMNDETSRQKLSQLISPFILRRTKEQVASDLPPLTEQIRYCSMTEEQARIYEEHKSLIRNKLLENIEIMGLEKSTFMALQGLTRLRQLANHPALYQFPEADSGKYNEVIQSLEDLMAEKHKVLIFSSFVTHLKLFQTEFEKRDWHYSCLTGQTRNREEVIQDFQQNEKKRIFLISLKAGGVGLNLTSADYIFILDPWWNPAAENQAINRAHRIGQDKKVFVYRFITENSIEEKIQLLKERKSALAGLFITNNNPFQAISKEEMVDLFQ
ncbi:MAG: ATP-dependent helicase [Prolixibacteraceae bacterium]|nr:ATP-dependent helicase [Prolixibacteraceae bacterium]